MASYWKSPYKEKTHSATLHETFTDHQTGPGPFVPVSSRPYCGLNKVKHTGPVSPQDWFDWAFTVSNSSLRPGPASSNFRHTRAAEIKGILKVPTDEAANDNDERLGNDSESNGSSRSDLGRREKKRVTFDESSATEASSSLRFHPSGSSSSLSSMLKQIHPLNGFPKHRSGHFPKLRKLPAVNGEGTLVHSIEKTEPKISSTCKHISELRCANCVSNSDAEKQNVGKSNVTPKDLLSVDKNEDKERLPDSQLANSVTASSVGQTPQSKSLKRSSQPPLHLHLNSGKDKNFDVSREPFKRYKPHWTKTFTRLPKRKQHARLAHRRNNSIPNTISHKIDSIKSDTSTSMAKKYFYEDFSKLRICGDGKLVQTKAEGQELSQGASQKTPGLLNVPKSTAMSSTNRFDSKIAPLIEPLVHSAPMTRRSSAPGRLREGMGFEEKGVFMDKTSQILSWLNDVRSKSHFKPRNTRTYAPGPT